MAGTPHTSIRIAPTRRQRQPLRRRLACHVITGLVWSVYLGMGVGTAAAYGYLDVDGTGLRPLASAALAVVCWPAVFLGADVHV